jgi:N-acetylmuramoyl-L-alanine amidase
MATAQCASKPEATPHRSASLASAQPPDLQAQGEPAFLQPQELPPELPSRRLLVVIDPGHGAKDNPGNTSCYCIAEQDFTLALAYDLEAALEALEGYDVVLSRHGSELVSYAERVAMAERLHADAFISLHSDIRGQAKLWRPNGAEDCKWSEEAPGFSVLFSDEAEPQLVTARRSLGSALAKGLLAANFSPYGGEEYLNLYAADAAAAGLFVDRHEAKKRVFVLRKPTIPSIIIETHNALDPREARRWEDVDVRHAFALAVAQGLTQFHMSQTTNE